MIVDPIKISSCFSSSFNQSPYDPHSKPVTKSGQTIIISIYRIKLANQCRLITITWCRNPLLLHGLSVSISGSGAGEYSCKVDVKPWCFWRKLGSKRFDVDHGKFIDVFWDLKSAKFDNGETEPSSDYYVAVVYDQEVVLLLGDLKIDVLKKTGFGPGLIEPVLVSRKEHVFGKKRFSTRGRFYDKGKFHHIVIECSNGSGRWDVNGSDLEMVVRVDGQVVIRVKNLEWKFRGNECVHVDKLKVEVYWDVHDWLFSTGLRHGLFIFKPVIPSSSLVSSSSSLSSLLSLSPSVASTPMSSRAGSSESVPDGLNGGSSEFLLFLYAWKME